MAVTTDMVRTWRRPREVMRDLLVQGQREDRAIAYVMAACLLIFISRLPALQYETVVGAGDFQRDASYAFMGLIMFAPLMLYALAAILHILAKIVGGKGTWYTARLALFWSLLTTTPLLLLYGLTVGLVGPGPQANLVGALWVAAFGILLFQCMREAERAQ